MYLLMSTSQNVDRVIRDFSNGNQTYAGAHLFFIDGMSEIATHSSGQLDNGIADRGTQGLDEQLFERLTNSPAEPHLKTLQELFVNFWGTPVSMLCSPVQRP